MALDWYFDFVSPFSYLQLERLRRDRPDIVVRPIPVVVGAVMAHWGTVGPAEIGSKRRHTYRMALWQARQLGVPMRFPPTHPFNPLPTLRLAVALGTDIDVVQTIFRHIWRDGNAADTPQALAPLAASLGVHDIDAATSDAAVKATLRANTDEAVAHGVFGVPTLRVDEELFWGVDATDMALAVLADPSLLSGDGLGQADDLPIGIQRARS